jgi:hypothetical protein
MSTAHSPASPAHTRVFVAALALAVAALLLAAAALTWAVTRDEGEPTGALIGSGVAAEDTRELAPFTAVELSGANEVAIGVGGEQRVVVRGDDNLLEAITTEVRGETLVVDQSRDFDSVTPMRVEITVPSLDELRLDGSGTIVLDGHDLGDLVVSLPGSGSIVGVGSVATLDVDLGGSGEIDFAGLVARDGRVALSGTGSVLVNVTGVLEANVSGAGSITYSGDPDRVEREITGAGSVEESP